MQHVTVHIGISIEKKTAPASVATWTWLPTHCLLEPLAHTSPSACRRREQHGMDSSLFHINFSSLTHSHSPQRLFVVSWSSLTLACCTLHLLPIAPLDVVLISYAPSVCNHLTPPSLLTPLSDSQPKSKGKHSDHWRSSPYPLMPFSPSQLPSRPV
jgi:hypothetical protein